MRPAVRCQSCPLSEGRCRGESNPRLCQLIDPTRPDHDPTYVRILPDPDHSPAEYPPLATQATNLAGSLRDWLRAGLPITPAAERMRRRAICQGCPHFDAEARRCRACGCFGSVKPWLATATCPQGKWGDPGKH